MQAIKIDGFGGPEVLKPTQLDKPVPAAGEVLIAVKAAGVNRPDCVQREGMYPPPPGICDTPGLEIAGVIDSVGEGVTSFKVGDEVCALVAGGGYAEYCLSPIETVLPKPDNMGWAEAACLPETFFTVWVNTFDIGGLKDGQSILIHGGSSGIGTVAIQLAKAFGAKVFTTAGSKEKCDACSALGADVVINYREQDFVEEVKKATDGNGVNVVLDMVGGDYVNRNLDCMAYGGKMVSIAFLNGMLVEYNIMTVMFKGLTLTGSTLRPKPNQYKAAIAKGLLENVWPLLNSGAVKPVMDKQYALENSADAHTRIEGGEHIGKIALLVNG